MGILSKYYYYVHTAVTSKPLTEDEQMKMLDTVIDTKKLSTGGLREITHKQWEEMFEVLNK